MAVDPPVGARPSRGALAGAADRFRAKVILDHQAARIAIETVTRSEEGRHERNCEKHPPTYGFGGRSAPFLERPLPGSGART